MITVVGKLPKFSPMYFKIKIKDKLKFYDLKDEILYVDNEFSIQKVEKILKKKSKAKEDDENEEDMLKGLTFNVHLSSDDLEAKKNLVLPYELIGQKQKTIVQNKDTESKIFYAPDEADDVDDDDPDDDLNF